MCSSRVELTRSTLPLEMGYVIFRPCQCMRQALTSRVTVFPHTTSPPIGSFPSSKLALKMPSSLTPAAVTNTPSKPTVTLTTQFSFSAT